MKKIYLFIIAALCLLLSPLVVWFASGGEKLSVAIIDKTVPDNTYREHLGLTWLLNYLKYEQGGSNYKAESDYFGYNPSVSANEETMPDDYNGYDVIYLADTYGVYEEDVNLHEEDHHGAKSPKIYGGLTEAEWTAIVRRLSADEKSLLVAEFNTFASPTNASVRKSVTDYLGVQWDGWTGRYFQDLSLEGSEMPQWIEDEYGGDWPYKGGGFLLVNDFTNDVEVLEFGEHVSEEGIRLTYTKEGKERFGLTESPNYHYWFDIVTTKNGAETLADYTWSLTAEGKEKLASLGIPTQFAAVIEQKRAQTRSYYFAGDYNDVQNVPSLYQAKGLTAVYKWANRWSESGFYWSAYVPMMTAILEQYKQLESVVAKKETELQFTSRLQNDQFEVQVDGKWEPLTVKGVNIGMGKPGAFPGEAAITEEEYDRWFESIADMNANMIRVYTIHPPGFYNALKRFNETSEKKLYVLHGIWIEEEGLEETLDAYDEETLAEFRQEMKTIVDIIHGNAIVKHVPGHASGVYEADVSAYVAGWIIGIEWYPYMVEKTNEKHRGIGEYNGTFFQTKGAAPFEYWLAEQMDGLLAYEQKTYNWIRPMSFTNWVTTDLLEHKGEPDEQEDLVSVDPNVIYVKGAAEKTGQFASYHVYPYYPDFFNYDEELKKYVDHRGNQNSYAGYLAALHKAHRLPVLIAEFGVPASRGLTHKNPYGWNQGFLSEREQGEIVTSLFEDILAEKLLGGLVFTWQDEWFKRTWNTADYDNPERRPYWSNAQTNEQQFGLLSFDRLKVKVDGDGGEWEQPPLNEGETALSVDHDERYVYIKIKGKQIRTQTPHILFDVVGEQGNTSMKGLSGVSFENGVDFVATVSRDESESRLVIDPYYDFHTYLYGKKLNLINWTAQVKNSGQFRQIEYALNRELLLPLTKKIVPFTSYEAGKLREGNGNPASADYDSLADYSWGEDVLELRIPWLLLQAKDPSQREFMGDLYQDGNDASVKVDGLSVGVVFADGEKAVSSIPRMENGRMTALIPYKWETWDTPLYEERLKQSYHLVQKAFQQAEETNQ